MTEEQTEELEPVVGPNDYLPMIRPQSDTEVMDFYTEALKLKDYAEKRIIAGIEDLKSATNDLSIISKVKKGIEEKRKEYLKPFQEHVKETNEAYKYLMEPIENADKITRDKVLNYNKEQEWIRLAQEEINRKRMEAAQEEMKLKGELTESVNLVEVIPEVPKRIHTDMGTTGMRNNWKYEVVDFALIPDEYKVVDSAMLTSIARKYHDQKQIPGVRFFNEPIIAVNTR